jgi:Leucine-rich repeat (LRR) protein
MIRISILLLIATASCVNSELESARYNDESSLSFAVDTTLEDRLILTVLCDDFDSKMIKNISLSRFTKILVTKPEGIKLPHSKTQGLVDLLVVENQYITQLSLVNLDLIELPSGIFQMKNLTFLDLSDNRELSLNESYHQITLDTILLNNCRAISEEILDHICSKVTFIGSCGLSWQGKSGCLYGC